MEATSDRRSFFQSPRNQRRILWAALALLAIGVGVFTFAFFRNTGDATETFSNEPADVYQPQKTVGVDPDARRVAGEFIKTAVARKNLAASYDLVSPELRQGMTRKQWATGEIPVVYYPSGGHPARDVQGRPVVQERGGVAGVHGPEDRIGHSIRRVLHRPEARR